MPGNVNQLSDTFTLDPEETIVSRFGTMKKGAELAEMLGATQWSQTIGYVAFGGVPSSADEAFKKLEGLEIKIRNELGEASERPGGKRSLGTGKTLDPNFKSYKSTLKGAFEHKVQILDAVGMPRSRNDIINDIKAAQPVKDAEDKLMGAAETFIKLDNNSDQGDPRTVDAHNHLLNYFRSKGYTITF